MIKGRGLALFEEYAKLTRVGRRRRLTTEARHAVWELYAEYDLALREAGIHDFADVILLAEKSLRTHPLDGYSSVIADEAQDLSCAMIRMLHAHRRRSRRWAQPDRRWPADDLPRWLHARRSGCFDRRTRCRHDHELPEHGRDRGLRGIRSFSATSSSTSRARLSRRMPRMIVRHGMRPRVSRFNSRAGHDRSLVAQVKSLIAGGHFGRRHCRSDADELCGVRGSRRSCRGWHPCVAPRRLRRSHFVARSRSERSSARRASSSSRYLLLAHPLQCSRRPGRRRMTPKPSAASSIVVSCMSR